MLEKTPYYLYIRDKQNKIQKFETHNEPQFGDIALRAPNSSIVYVSTGPLPPKTSPIIMGIEPSFDLVQSHLRIRKTSSVRYCLCKIRPSQFDFDFRAKITQWVKAGNSWHSRKITQLDSSHIKLDCIYYYFDAQGKIKRCRFGLSGLPRDKRWPVRVRLSVTGGSFTGNTTYNNSYMDDNDAENVSYAAETLPMVSATSSLFNKSNLIVSVRSGDTYLK